MFMFLASITGCVTTIVVGNITTAYHIKPEDDPKGYGEVILYSTIIPCAIAIPCFYMSGRKYV